MKYKLFFFLCLFACSVLAQTKNTPREEFYWEKVVPLVTKKAEVESYFGKPYLENAFISFYETESGRISVMFSKKKSSDIGEYKCNVPPDTVIDFSIDLTKRLSINELGWNLDNFERFPQDDGYYVYSYGKKGLSFTVHSEDKEQIVRTIGYTPSLADLKSKCVKK